MRCAVLAGKPDTALDPAATIGPHAPVACSPAAGPATIQPLVDGIAAHIDPAFGPRPCIREHIRATVPDRAGPVHQDRDRTLLMQPVQRGPGCFFILKAPATENQDTHQTP